MPVARLVARAIMMSWQVCLYEPTSDIIGRTHSISTPDCILFTASATKRNFLVVIKQMRTQKLKPQDHICSLLTRLLWGPKLSTHGRDSNHGPDISRTLLPFSVLPCLRFVSQFIDASPFCSIPKLPAQIHQRPVLHNLRN